MKTKKMKKEMALIISLFFLSLPCFAHRGQFMEEDSDRREARDECLSELGLEKPEEGTRPSREEMKSMGECMSAKGYERPQGPPPHHRGSRQGEERESDQGTE